LIARVGGCSVVPGTPESAPARPRFLFIVGLTTFLSSVVFALVYAVLVWQVLDLAKLPIGPR
jgi:predicted secreted protein